MKVAVLVLLFATTAPAAIIDDVGVSVERYEYLAIPRGKQDPRRHEVHRVTITTIPSGMRYAYTTTQNDLTEVGWIDTDPDAVFKAAFRMLEEDEDGKAQEDSLWRDGNRLFAQRRKLPRNEVEWKEFELPDDKPLAVYGSLLLWIRRFPFAADEQRRVYMVDFSQRDVTVRIERKGVEIITVPAGTFECDHLEVVVKVFILKATIHFWITTEEPYFMVRHQGKRGPFSNTYDTELIRAGEFTE